MKEKINEWLATLPDKFISPSVMVTKVGSKYVTTYNLETSKYCITPILEFYETISNKIEKWQNSIQ